MGLQADLGQAESLIHKIQEEYRVTQQQHRQMSLETVEQHGFQLCKAEERAVDLQSQLRCSLEEGQALDSRLCREEHDSMETRQELQSELSAAREDDEKQRVLASSFEHSGRELRSELCCWQCEGKQLETEAQLRQKLCDKLESQHNQLHQELQAVQAELQSRPKPSRGCHLA